MKYYFDVRRQKSPDKEHYHERFEYEAEDDNQTVATVLEQINMHKDNPIRWECSCLQNKCGACAMVINGKPRLACDAYLKEVARMKGGKRVITVAPLRKFPIVEDLVVDRTLIHDHLREMMVWTDGDVEVKDIDWVAELGKCLQCGCCLEICPSFDGQSSFYGTSVAVGAARVLHALGPEKNSALIKSYDIHMSKGCGKSFACQSVCPAGIDMEHLLVAMTHMKDKANERK